MRWTWNAEKKAANKRKHGLSFETAVFVFDDPLAVSRPDVYPFEERFHTIGVVGNETILVVHTSATVKQIGRIISARKATKRERRIYEEEDF